MNYPAKVPLSLSLDLGVDKWCRCCTINLILILVYLCESLSVGSHEHQLIEKFYKLSDDIKCEPSAWWLKAACVKCFINFRKLKFAWLWWCLTSNMICHFVSVLRLLSGTTLKLTIIINIICMSIYMALDMIYITFLVLWCSAVMIR